MRPTARRRAALGLAAGVVVGGVALLNLDKDWIFDYLLLGPWGVADLVNDAAGTPEWLFYPIACVYFGVAGCIGGLAITKSWRVAYAFGVVATLILGHLGLTVMGAQRFADELRRGMQQLGPLPVPKDIFPKNSPTPAR